MSSSEHEDRMLYGTSAARTPAPMTPLALVTCMVTPRRNPPGVTFATTSCAFAPSCALNVENGASRYALLPAMNGISCPAAPCESGAGGAATPPGTGISVVLSLEPHG